MASTSTDLCESDTIRQLIFDSADRYLQLDETVPGSLENHIRRNRLIRNFQR